MTSETHRDWTPLDAGAHTLRQERPRMSETGVLHRKFEERYEVSVAAYDHLQTRMCCH